MKKFFSFILAAILCCTSNVWAGKLTVADGTKSNNCVPYDGYSGDYFQRVQIIYPQSELSEMAGKDITSLTFYVNSKAPSALGVKVQIGLAEISDSDFSAGKDYKSATLTIVKAEDVWDLNAETVVVEFSKPFSYSGEGSILFDLQTVAIGGYGNTSFYGVGSLANYQSAYSYAESSIPATSSNRYKFIPKTTFTYEEPAPVVLANCELAWKDVPEGGVVGTIGHEDEIKLPYFIASTDFVIALEEGTATLRLGSTDESVLTVNGFNDFAVNGVGECDVYIVHDEDAVFAYDSAAFHVTVNPEPQQGEPVDVTIGSWYFEDFGGDGELILYSPDSTIRFYFDLNYGQDASDLILGKEYTVGDVYVDEDGQYAGIYTNGDWDYGIKSLSLIKTIDANQHVHFVGSVVDIIDRAFTFHYDEEAAPTPEPEPEPQQGIVCTAEDLDKVLCSDGSIYENVAAATAASKTAVAMIASINTTTNKVVAIALADEAGTMDWETAQSTCAAKTAVAGVAWTALSLDQIFGILEAHNGGEFGYYADLNTTIANVGGTSIPTQIEYWTKDEFKTTDGVCFHFDADEDFIAAGFVEKATTLSVRACLEFDLTDPVPTAVENVQTNPAQATKFFRDGQLLIEKNGKIYNVMGAEVK